MNERSFDQLLNIKTEGGQKGFGKSMHYHRYEPTPYAALEKLFHEYELNSSDQVVDFGCGKGRTNFYIHYLSNAAVKGIEMNEEFYQEAIQNRNRYVKKAKNRKGQIQFYCCLAEEYKIDPADNRFYFFNPFSKEIFMNVINNILQSVEVARREIELILYYCSEEYIYFLENQTAFEFKKEVILPGFHDRNPFERFLIYRLDY
ncbi:methyltransferase [Metabacillus idriensis]|uniref:methyltransferase n=1 Tax=Metabacillus idriensis TaxID=324768 RepID=UPI0028137D1B|nr:methyltransferase [Metabacillus idriensis]MDR0137996.1 methyltransferase [Metabacillus idriensis]